jgi:hypothetical protein
MPTYGTSRHIAGIAVQSAGLPALCLPQNLLRVAAVQRRLLAETVRELTETPPPHETVIFDTVLARFALQYVHDATPRSRRGASTLCAMSVLMGVNVS